MGPSSLSFSSRGWNGFRRLTKVQTPASVSFHAVRAVLLAAIASAMLIYIPTRSATPARALQILSGCSETNQKIDVAFLIDRSASLSIDRDPVSPMMRPGRGQTYNTEIAGVLRALRDPTVIPRDGSVAVAVVTFDGNAVVREPLEEIDSAAIAEQLAKRVEGLMCRCDGDSIDPCPFGATSYTAAITVADKHLKQRRRANAHRVFLMATDGYATDTVDPNKGREAAAQADDGNSQLDVVLMGGNPGSDAGPLVFPQPGNDLPGETLTIVPGLCNDTGAGCNGNCDLPVCDFVSNCEKQACAFANFTREVLRSGVPRKKFVVNTAEDPPANTPSMNETGSLRQAIEFANCHGGATTITFACNVKTIIPVTPLPALAAPEITIDGLKDRDPNCTLVTIDGSSTDTTMGEAHSDGILIRSFNDIVRGLRIVNFKRAGIAIEPIRQLDNVASNLIELNKLADNGSAGVLVRDPDQNKPSAVFHNVGNTISQNTIFGIGPLIDLGGDGGTLDDPADVDEGPNTLLNFPDPFTSDTTGANVTFTGKVNLSSAACTTNDPVVEIFSVTRIRNASGVAVVQAVTPFKKIFLDKTGDGAFSATFKKDTTSAGPADASCPIDGYTATFTDSAGNTSELIPFCTGPARAKLSSQTIEFDEVNPGKGSNGSTKSFAVENCGCSTLDLRLASIEREGEDIARLVRQDDSDSRKGSGIFSLRQIKDSGEPLETPIHTRDNIVIDPGESQRFSIVFNPRVPRVISADGTLLPRDVIPSNLRATLTFQPNNGDLTLSLIGHVTTPVRMIDPETPTNPPSVILTRSGDELIVTFAVFDPNLDVKKNPVLNVSYEFTENGGAILPEPPDTNLAEAIVTRQPRLVQGQSFIVIQRFSNAKQHKKVSSVKVTVSDGETTVSASSAPMASLTVTARSDSLRDGGDGALIVPVVKLGSASGERAPVKRSTTAEKGKRR